MNKQPVPTLTIGIGTIGPEPRLADKEINETTLHQVINALQSDELFAPVTSTIPSACVDGRSPANVEAKRTPKSAAGTFSAVVGDALTSGRFLQHDDSAIHHANRVYMYLIKNGYLIGGHDAAHAGGDGCGCGAQDNFSTIMRYILEHGDIIRQALQSAGVQITDGVHATILNRVHTLLETSYANVTGRELRQVYIDTAGEAAVEHLDGPHHEVAIVLNTKAGTLDRAKMRALFSDAYQAFDVDFPAVRELAHVMSVTDDEATQKYVAMLYYNVATAAVLSHPSLFVVMR